MLSQSPAPIFSHLLCRREDIIRKAFPIDQKISSTQIRERRRILGSCSPKLASSRSVSSVNNFLAGKDLRPGMSEKEVELLLFDEGFLSSRDVWNVCEELELQVRAAVAQTKLQI